MMQRHGVSAAAVALAWVLRHPSVIAIPKMASLVHLQDNLACLDLVLEPEDYLALDVAFPAPDRKQALEML